MPRIQLIMLYFVYSLIFSHAEFPHRLHAQPKIAKDKIPNDIASYIREEIEKLYSKNPVERGYAAMHLRSMGKVASPAVPFLAAMLHDETSLSREISVPDITPGFKTIPSPLSERHSSPLPESISPAELAAEALAAIGSGSVEALQQSLANRNTNVRVRAARALGEIGDASATQALINALHDNSWQVRALAASALGSIGDKKATQPLLSLLNDQDSEVRSSAAKALAQIGDTTCTNALSKLLSDPDLGVRLDAAISLGKLRDGRGVETLRKGLEHPWEYRSEKVIMVLRDMKSPKAVEALIHGLRNKNLDVRWGCCSALGKTKDKTAIPALLKFGSGGDWLDRNMACDALEELTGKKLGKDFPKWEGWWKENRDTLQNGR